MLIHHAIENGESLTPLREAKTFEWACSPESGQIENETTGLKNNIHSLTKDHREVIYLKFHTGLTYSEIAEITKLHIDTVYDLVSKALGLISKEVQVSTHPMPVH